MAMGPRPPARRCRNLLLAMTTIACFGCTSATPPDPASRTYPAVATGCACPVAPTATHWFQRVLIIVLENQDYQAAIADPYLEQLASEGASFTNFHGLFHPSYPNYLAMVAGKGLPTHGDWQKDFRECTIADLLQSKRLSWKNYAQGYPGNDEQCFQGDRFDRYARKHVPFMSFVPVQQHQCGNIVAASQFDTDIRNDTRPVYAFYSPDLDNDAHDTGLPRASKWLKDFLGPFLHNPAFMKGTLIIVTFDESKSYSKDVANHIYTVFLGPMVKRGMKVEDNYNHYNVLRTIEDNFGLCALGEGDGGAKPITSVWK
jgi:hypothetical protein